MIRKNINKHFINNFMLLKGFKYLECKQIRNDVQSLKYSKNDIFIQIRYNNLKHLYAYIIFNQNKDIKAVEHSFKNATELKNHILTNSFLVC